MLAATIRLAILNILYNNQFVSYDSSKGAVLYRSDTFFIIQNWTTVYRACSETCQTSRIKVLEETVNSLGR